MINSRVQTNYKSAFISFLFPSESIIDAGMKQCSMSSMSSCEALLVFFVILLSVHQHFILEYFLDSADLFLELRINKSFRGIIYYRFT